MNWTLFSVRSLSGFVISDSWGRNFVSIYSRVSIDLRLGSTLYTAVPSVCGLRRLSSSLYWIMFIPRMPSSPGLDEFRDFNKATVQRARHILSPHPYGMIFHSVLPAVLSTPGQDSRFSRSWYPQLSHCLPWPRARCLQRWFLVFFELSLSDLFPVLTSVS